MMMLSNGEGIVHATTIGGSRSSAHELLQLLERPAWHADAACREHPELTWYPAHGADQTEARTICASCLVRDECRAAGASEDFGIWGGVNANTRRAAGIVRTPKPTPVENPPKPPRLIIAGAKHGTQRGFRVGCRCEPCTAASAAYWRQRRSA